MTPWEFDQITPPLIRRLVMERFHVFSTMSTGMFMRDSLRVDEFMDLMGEHLRTFLFSAEALSKIEIEDEVVTEQWVPNCWWQHFKKQYRARWWYPRRILGTNYGKHAIPTKVIKKRVNVCPHLNVSRPKNGERIHYEFLDPSMAGLLEPPANVRDAPTPQD